MNKKILLESILAVALILLVSFSNVVGYNATQTNFVFEKDDDYRCWINGTIGDNGWYVSEVTITFIWNPDVISAIYWKIDGSQYELYTEPIIIGDDGEHIFEFYVVDIYGNSSVPIDCEFGIDKIAPDIDILWDNDNLLIITDTFDVTSGVAKVEFYVNDNFVGEDYNAPWEWYYPDAKMGDTALGIAFDNAGNQGVSNSICINRKNSQKKQNPAVFWNH